MHNRSISTPITKQTQSHAPKSQILIDRRTEQPNVVIRESIKIFKYKQRQQQCPLQHWTKKEQTNQQTNIIMKKAKELNKDIYLTVKKKKKQTITKNKRKKMYNLVRKEDKRFKN